MATKPKYRRYADGSTELVMDGLTNVVANLGTSRDKASASQITVTNLDPVTLMTTYRGSWAARKGVDIPALDSCRKWREWQAQSNEVEEIENEENRLNVQGKVLKARIAARLFGGCALLIGADVSDPTKPLNLNAVAKGGLRYLAIIHQRMLSPGMMEENPESPYFGQPAYWDLNAGGRLATRIHPSRLVIFHGRTLPDDAYATTQVGWGDSVLTAAIDTVLSFDGVAANIGSLVFEAKVDTIGIPNFMQRLGDTGFETTVLKRFALAEAGKGINGTLIHDAEEILGQKQASFASLPDILDRFAVNVCAAFDIPVTRFMGQSPAGLSSTGESDIRNYYDAISSSQELEMGPAMQVLDECLIRSAMGTRPPEVHYRWASLWQVSDKERAANGKTYADTIVALKGTGLFPDEPLAEAAINLMTESGAMPGLEGYMADYFAPQPDTGAPDVTPQEEAGS